MAAPSAIPSFPGEGGRIEIDTCFDLPFAEFVIRHVRFNLGRARLP